VHVAVRVAPPEQAVGQVVVRVERAALDDVARADHQLIKAGLAASGPPIERVGGTFLSDGRVRWAFFMSTHGAPFATSWSLEYDPEGTRSPGPAGIVTLTPVEGE